MHSKKTDRGRVLPFPGLSSEISRRYFFFAGFFFAGLPHFPNAIGHSPV